MPEAFMIQFMVTADQCATLRDGLIMLTQYGGADQRERAEALLDIHPTSEDVMAMIADAQTASAAMELRAVEGNKALGVEPEPGVGIDVDDPGLL